ncbi:MAG: SGNH/GDSL hydrolase family protein [Proteobacteria bacterium]|nr:SGNH/GDSL hydrolase family protein [Pseudomonadota bacterium]
MTGGTGKNLEKISAEPYTTSPGRLLSEKTRPEAQAYHSAPDFHDFTSNEKLLYFVFVVIRVLSMKSQEFPHNRFEKLYQKWRQKFANAKPGIWRGVRRALIWGVPIFLAFEILAVGLAMNKLAGYGVPGDVARQHFYLSRYTLNLFLDTPNIDEFERVTNSPYIGFEHACDFFIADSLLGWRNHPKISCSFLYPAGGAPYTTNLMWTAFDVDGFVVTEKGGPRYIREKPENVFRIIMLGGSTLAGYGAPPLESIAGHAQHELNRLRPVADGYDRIEVINAGVAGFDSAQEYLYLLSELIYYKPDIVVFYDGWNESINRHGHFSDALFAYMRKAKKFKPVPFSSIQMKWHRDYSAQIEKGFRPLGAAVMLSSFISVYGGLNMVSA